MRARELQFRVRPKIVLAIVGQLLGVVAGLTLAPAAVAFVVGDLRFGWRCVAVVAVLAACAAAARRLPRPRHLQTNEAMVISVTVFTATPLLMSYAFAATGLAPMDAVFESFSAVTTTGLSMVADVRGESPAFVFARAWMQWYGGLGFVVLSLALVVRPGPLARKLAAPAGNGDDELLGSARAHGRMVLIVYAAVSAAGFVALLVCGSAPFTALVHVLSGISTGGFSSYPDSLGGMEGSAAPLVSTAICLAGALPLAGYVRVWRHGPGEAWRDPQIATMLAVAAVGSLTLGFVLRAEGNMPAAEALWHGTIQMVSAQTTSGFSSLDIGALEGGAQTLLLLAMFVGGCSGSTAGGAKLIRAVVAFQVLRAAMWAASAPSHAVVEPRLGGRSLDAGEARALLATIVLLVALIAVSWLSFAVAAYPPMASLFEVVSATATVGLSSGITAAELPSHLKLVLCADMLLGRLECIAVLVALYPRTWVGRQREE